MESRVEVGTMKASRDCMDRKYGREDSSHRIGHLCTNVVTKDNQPAIVPWRNRCAPARMYGSR